MLLDPPPPGSVPVWLRSLPFFEEFCGKGSQQFLTSTHWEWPPKLLLNCPPQLTDLLRQTLQWHPAARLTAASASNHMFVRPLDLSVPMRKARGKNGTGSIAAGFLDEDVLAYLQKCPTWADLVAECVESNFAPNDCISLEEGGLRMKREFVGFVDDATPPKCRSLNSDANLKLMKSNRLTCFVRAFRRCAKDWLQQLTSRVRAAIKRERLPDDFLLANGARFLDEDFADNAFVYASVQVLKSGERQDGWHTDGGTSLLHAALTLFGARRVDVECGEGGGCISLHQKPGSFYVGNMCALKHHVVHHAHSTGTYGDGDIPVQIAVMLRSDYFRAARARRINATPGPAELFRIVNAETAKQLAEQPLYLPGLAEVQAEAVATDGGPRC